MKMHLISAGCLPLTLLCLSALPAQDLDWARAEGGSSGEISIGVAGFDDASSAAIGLYYATATFGRGESNETSLPLVDPSLYIARYESDGSLRWAGSLSSKSLTHASSSKVAASPDGATYVGTNIRHGSVAHPITVAGPNGTVTGNSMPSDRSGIVARYSASGAAEWVVVINSAYGVSSFVRLADVAARSDNSVVAIGSFLGSVDFGNSITLSAQPSNRWNAFVAVYDSNGNIVWAEQVSGRGGGSPGKSFVAVAADDSVLISDLGYRDATGANALIFGSTPLIAPVGADFPRYIARFTSSGTLDWAKFAIQSGLTNTADFDAAADGSTVLAGHVDLADVLTFAPGTSNATAISASSSSDAWVARWNVLGELEWVETLADTDYARALGVAAFSDDTVAVTGQVSGTITAGTVTASSITGRLNAFVATLDVAGSGTWVTTIRASTRSQGYDIDGSAGGSMFATGNFLGSNVDVQGINGSATISALGGLDDMYLAKWNSELLEIGELPDLARECDGSTSTATINFVVDVTGAPPVGSTLEVLDVTGSRSLLSALAAEGSYGVGPFFFPIGASIVESRLLDSQGAVLQLESFQVIVADTTKPTLIGIGTKTIECQDELTTLLRSLLGISASDTCDAKPSVAFSPSAIAVGTTVVTAIATDASGNTESASFSVTVEDTRPPVFTEFPADITRECDGPSGTNVSFSLSAFDACSIITITCLDQTGRTIDPLGTTFADGIHTVTCTAVDGGNNAISASFLVTIEDTAGPVIICPSDITVSNDPGACFAQVAFAVTATSNCDPNVAITLEDAFFNTLQSGDAFPVGTTSVIATAMDNSGNTVVCTFNITVQDVDAPVISGPTSMDLVTDCAGTVLSISPSTLGLVADDNCPGAPTVTCSPATLSPGTTSVACTATDSAGNMSQHQVSVTLLKGAFDCLVLRPLDPTVDNKIRPGQTIAVKLRVTCGNVFDSAVTASIDSVTNIAISGSPIANEVVEDSGVSNDNGNLMRLPIGNEFFIYNLSSSSWTSTPGARFLLKLRIQKAGHVDTVCDVYFKNR